MLTLTLSTQIDAGVVYYVKPQQPPTEALLARMRQEGFAAVVKATDRDAGQFTLGVTEETLRRYNLWLDEPDADGYHYVLDEVEKLVNSKLDEILAAQSTPPVSVD